MRKTPDDTAASRAAAALEGSPFLDTQQAAFYLGISVRTLQEYRSAGIGPRCRRYARRVRYHIDDLNAWSLMLVEERGDD